MRKNAWLAAVLCWLLLLNKSLVLNMERARETAAAAQAEKEANVESAAAPTEQVNDNLAEKNERTEQEEEPDIASDTVTYDRKTQEAPACIRVLLTDSDFQSAYHSSVTVLLDGEEKTYTSEELKDQEEPVVLEAEQGITVSSIQRQQGNPVYMGRLEIYGKPEGLLLINELPVEAYLEAVVPSEMPSSCSMEALKAQAVCARTYACSQMEEGRMEEYGADVDDSVNFQVYGNIAPQESTSQAVRETEGQVLTQDGKLIQAYYFSTSAGATSTDEVWGASEEASYLKSVECEFDSQEPWSSWEVTIPWEILEDRAQRSCSLSGRLESFQVTKKSQGGAVIGLMVNCAEGSCEIQGEYQVRKFFAPGDCTLTGRDGTVLESSSLLPSAYFTMGEASGDGVTLHGGGYGHGVGMSQNAADEMGKQGYNYKEILNYFFRDVELTVLW